MIYSTSKEVPSETEITLIKNAALSSYNEYGNEADVDRVYEYLKDPSKTSEELLELECSEGQLLYQRYQDHVRPTSL